MAMTLKFWMGKQGDKCKWDMGQPSENEEGTRESLFFHSNFFIIGIFNIHMTLKAEQLLSKDIFPVCVWVVEKDAED